MARQRRLNHRFVIARFALAAVLAAGVVGVPAVVTLSRVIEAEIVAAGQNAGDTSGRPGEPVAARLTAARRAVAVVVGGSALLIAGVFVLIIRRGARPMVQRLEAQDRALALLDALPDLVATVGADGRLRDLNDAGRRMLGVAAGADVTRLRLGDRWPEGLGLIEAVAALPPARRERAWTGESALRRPDGEVIPIAYHLIPGPRRTVSAVVRDIRERCDYEAQIAQLASHDALTGLFNRRRFEEELERELAQSRRYGTRGAVLFLDLDEFKTVNDHHGHRAGDAVLAGLAATLQKRLRETDTLARFGGDEFVLLLAHTDAEQAQTIAGRILEAIRRDPAVHGGRPERISASIGIATFPRHAGSAEDLLTWAERAMYRAKEQGRNRCVVYSSADDTLAAGDGRTWEQRIRDAMTEERLFLVAQPILDLRTDRISHYEVLLRMRAEDGAIVPPNVFLGVAERTGLIHEIDRWVVRSAIRLLADQEQAGNEITMEVNLSGKAFMDPELLPLIQYELLRTRILPSRLVLEITETAAIADLTQAQTFIDTLRRWGCRFALDDFGVGFSSFSYLKHLPADYVKLDGSFIRNLPHDRIDQHLVKAMVEVARGVGKQTIAEFVGDAETVRLLREFGVDYAQGFHVGRPRAVAEVLPAVAAPSRAA